MFWSFFQGTSVRRLRHPWGVYTPQVPTLILSIAVGAVIAANFCNYGCHNYRRSLGESLIIDGPQFSISKSYWKIKHATFGRISINVPGFISKTMSNRTSPGTFVSILQKVAVVFLRKLFCRLLCTVSTNTKSEKSNTPLLEEFR